MSELHNDPNILLEVSHLKQYFKMGHSTVKAVDDVSFYIKRGEVFGLVGESGCGKTTTGRAIIKLYEPTGGNIWFNGQRISSGAAGVRQLEKDERQASKELISKWELARDKQIKENPADADKLRAEFQKRIDDETERLNKEIAERRKEIAIARQEERHAQRNYREMRIKQVHEKYDAKLASAQGQELEDLKGAMESEMELAKRDNIRTKMQMIFQDPIASINPRMTVREIIAEGLIIRGVRDKKFIDQKVFEVLDMVGLVPEHANRYPHEFSGGQRQRIGIARAIVLEPDMIIADEPISALDVSIQAQVINLLNDLRDKMGLTILFIAHNLSVVKYFSDRIAVMYFGKLVELASSEELFKHPLHPYTRSLLSAIPYPDPHFEKRRQRITYVPAREHDYSVDQPKLIEISPEHFVLCNEQERQKYLEMLQA